VSSTYQSFRYLGTIFWLGVISILTTVIIVGVSVYFAFSQPNLVSSFNSRDTILPELSHSLNKTDIEINQYLIDVTGRLDYWTTFLEKLGPPYNWGKALGPSGGDCSGQLYWVAHKSGLPFLRTTSLQMWYGAWPGVQVKDWYKSEFPNLVFFTFTSKRPFGHVGVVRKNEYPSYLVFSEASQGFNAFKRTTMSRGPTTREKSVVGVKILDLTVGFDKSESLKKNK